MRSRFSWENYSRSLRRWCYDHPVIAILLLGFVLRMVLFNVVSVNPDTGLYLYDTKLLLEGNVPDVDYPSRSPLFHALLSPAYLLGFSPLVTARIIMVAVSSALGLAVYFVTKEIHSREAGIAAFAVFTLSPFVLAWGLWVKTEQVAQLLVLVGLVPLLSHLDKDRFLLRGPALLGIGVGAAFFVRRVVIVHFFAVILFLFYYRFQVRGKSILDPLLHIVTFVTSTGITLAIGYLIWSGANPQTMGSLIRSDFSSLPLPLPVMNTGDIYIRGGGSGVLSSNPQAGAFGTLNSFLDFLADTIEKGFSESNFTVYYKTTVLFLPALLIVLVYPVVYIKERVGIAGAVVPPLLLGWDFLDSGGYVNTTVGMIILGAGVVVLAATNDRISFDKLWNPKLSLPSLIAVATVVGYAQRDWAFGSRDIFATYYQDAFPYIAVLAGVVVFELWRRDSLRFSETPLQVGCLRDIFSISVGRSVSWWGILLIAIIITSGFTVTPAGTIVERPDNGPNELSNSLVTDVVSIGNDLNDKYGDGAKGFSAQPIYSIEAGHRVANDLSRKHWSIVRRPNSTRSQLIINETAAELESGEVDYAINERRTERITIGELNRTFNENFCREDKVTEPWLYPDFSATAYDTDFYTYNSSAPEC